MNKILTLFSLLLLSNGTIPQTHAQVNPYPTLRHGFVGRRPQPQPQPRTLPQPHVRQYYHLPVGHHGVAPESIAFDCEGNGPYVGVSNGRILKWQGASHGWTIFAETNPNRGGTCDGLNNSPEEQRCGRPLGLKFNTATCELYIADSSYGLVKVGRDGGVATSVANQAEGIPFRFLNALDIDSESGYVYFTDSSSRHPRWEFPLITASDRSGRLMRYNTKTKRVSVLYKGLSFANGVALSKNKDFILITETTTFHIQRYWLTGPKAGTAELFMQLTGRPDNINRNSNGDFWIAQNPTKPIKVDEFGRILEILNTDAIVDISDVTEFHNNLWIGSVIQGYIMYTSS